ncbi:hypothetical protein OUZ56_015182 [Daphnia magna]|uniref:Uncharacterized protein n=1 Tax=Daphnia magna TaxID=35525 RepID=A0ABR0AM25_9CRUS|nr:hypothetical protein OUZ56_015182 [Daphnia magna]
MKMPMAWLSFNYIDGHAARACVNSQMGPEVGTSEVTKVHDPVTTPHTGSKVKSKISDGICSQILLQLTFCVVGRGNLRSHGL